jgi:methylphosphonate synthase
MLGARLLAEANDIKRTPEALAAELGVPLARLRAAFAGELEAADYRGLFERVAQHYPIAFGQLWIDPPDTDGGVLHVTAAASAASSRVFERAGRGGAASPYYEYRDTAMSRTAPFRPEWIRPLRAVGDLDPRNPDVAYNKGHFLHQTTLFVGPVNFYWEVDGVAQCEAMDTGDSNYITPFRPHSFASRASDCPGYIVAVTYGGEIARARDELARLGPAALPALTLELRDEAAAHAALLCRHLEHEALPAASFVDRCAERKVPAARVEAALAGHTLATIDELAVMAEVLQVTVRDLLPPARRIEDEVVVTRRPAPEPYPDASAPAYEILRLARSRQQPYLKSFLVRVLPGGRAPVLRAALHQYVFNPGEVSVRLVAGEGAEAREVVLGPHDSAYVQPLAPCRFVCDGARAGEVFLVRVPGALHADAVFELSGVAPAGLHRAAAETTRWF